MRKQSCMHFIQYLYMHSPFNLPVWTYRADSLIQLSALHRHMLCSLILRHHAQHQLAQP